MARGSDRDRRRSQKDLGRRGGKKKVCVFCKEHLWVDYKDVNLLRRFQSDRGKIRARRVTGNCAQHHREVAVAIKTARELALLPYTQRTVVERAGGRSLRVVSPSVPEEAETTASALAEEDVVEASQVGAEVVAEDLQEQPPQAPARAEL
jgi:small subunit ribosomal protein S18